jgi:photosystem II stability/assembly factor-like uncharacterized protein
MKQVLTGLLLLAFHGSMSQITPMQPNVHAGGRAVAATSNPFRANQLIVASESGGLFKSINSGANWTHVSGTTSFDYTDVMYYPFDGNIVIATAAQDTRSMSGGGILRSTDGGNTWSRVSVITPDPSCLASIGAYGLSYERGTTRIWAGTSCGLAYSDDAGVTWGFVATSTNYNNDKVYAVLSPARNNLKILTDAGVKVSTDGGANWTFSSTGLPTVMWRIDKGWHNQIACSPLNQRHLFWAFAYITATNMPRNGLYMSVDNGNSWSAVVDNAGQGRPPFVEAAYSLNGTSSQFDLYYANGTHFKRGTFNNAATPTMAGSWFAITADHDDPTDIIFRSDNRTPLLYLTDGGIHITANSGANWTLTGGGNRGYNALQITEVTGQRHSSDLRSDLYFATQDDSVWASPDEGATWPAKDCCEGFFVNVQRQPISPADTKITMVRCFGCANVIYGPMLASPANFPNPTNSNGNPRLLRPGTYIQSSQAPGTIRNVFNLTTNNGTDWVPKYGFDEEVRDFSRVSRTGTATTIFTAVRMPGSTPDNQEMVGIKKITGVLDAGTPIVSDITGFGSLGIFRTMFAWYKPFGVDPQDPNHLIVLDIIDNLVKFTRNGGMSWEPDSALTRLVTENGSFKFRSGPFTQISNIAFDPEQPGHILVGTIQTGIFRSCDGGDTWAKIAYSENIPYVSSFYFPGNGKVIASSYGRGLWRLDVSRCEPRFRKPDLFPDITPVIYYQGVWIPVRDLGNPDFCPRCVFYFVEKGEIRAYTTSPGSNKVESVTLSEGAINGLDTYGKSVNLSFKTQIDSKLASAFSKDEKLVQAFNAKYQVKGIYLEDNIFKGLILAKEDLTAKNLPQLQQRPVVRGELVYAGKYVQGIRIYGAGFNQQYPLQIMLDGKALQLQNKEKYDTKQMFSLEIMQPFSTGGHTILIIQKNDTGMLKEAYSFNVPLIDDRKKGQ